MLSFKSFYDAKESNYNEILAKLERERESIGYYSLPFDKKIVTELDKYQERDLTKIKNIVVIGIGGSSLGAKAVDGAIKHTKETKKLIFLENSDPLNLVDSLKDVTKENSLFIVISKSGSTMETISIFKFILNRYELDLDKNRDSLIVITDLDSPLSKFAKKHSIAEFNIYPNVGGRFSVLSAVGLVPLALAGYDVKALLDGAKEFLNSFFERKELSLLDRAFSFVENQERAPINILFSYSTLLKEFSSWYVQLWGESLGKIDKNNKSVGLTPICLIGSTDQHSFLQLIIEGPKDKKLTFIKVKDFGCDIEIPNITIENIEKTDYINGVKFETLINAQCDATLESIVESGVDVDLIEIDSLNEKTLGEMIIYFELLTSSVGILLDVNTYNQPGVELGKVKLVEKFKKA